MEYPAFLIELFEQRGTRIRRKDIQGGDTRRTIVQKTKGTVKDTFVMVVEAEDK